MQSRGMQPAGNWGARTLLLSVVGAGIGVAWFYAMSSLAILVGAAGHGSFLPTALVYSPFWAGFVLWPCIFMLVAAAPYRAARALGAALIVLSYIRVPWTFPPQIQFMTELRHLDRFSAVVVALYSATQILLWWRILRAKWPGKREDS